MSPLEQLPSLFSKAIIPLEKRELAKNLKFIKKESLWPKVCQPGIIHSYIKEVVELAFCNGGYIAGGFAKWANTDDISVISRSVYVSLGGDVDLFFRTQEGFEKFLTELENLNQKETVTIKRVGLSVGKLAVNILFSTKDGIKVSGANKMPTMQAIGCVVGEPDMMMQSFDFINCMIAFDDKNTWINESQEFFESKKQLAISCWSSKSLPHRINKYINKYGYTTCVDYSENRKKQLYSASKDSYDAAKRFCNAWTSFFSGNSHNPFENNEIFFEIYSLFILPFSTISLQNLTKYFDSTYEYEKNPAGSYHACLEVMKQQKFFERDVSSSDNSLIEVPAEQYCWSF